MRTFRPYRTSLRCGDRVRVPALRETGTVVRVLQPGPNPRTWGEARAIVLVTIDGVRGRVAFGATEVRRIISGQGCPRGNRRAAKKTAVRFGGGKTLRKAASAARKAVR